jgi:hypothetical protein
MLSFPVRESPDAECTPCAHHTSVIIGRTTHPILCATDIFAGCSGEDTVTITQSCATSTRRTVDAQSRAYRRLQAATRAVFEAAAYGVRS